jgi:hypothetical protein
MPKSPIRTGTGSDTPCETFKYRVDGNDILLEVSENWQSFSDENSGGEACFPRNVIGSSLWRHICEWETKQLYQTILERVRMNNQRACFPFRCDSPDKRRFLNLLVIPMERNCINFESRILKTESREPVALLSGEVKRSEELLRICSMCKKIAISDTEWVEVETAVRTLGLFERVLMPRFTHGVCQSCFDSAIAELDAAA